MRGPHTVFPEARSLHKPRRKGQKVEVVGSAGVRGFE